MPGDYELGLFDAQMIESESGDLFLLGGQDGKNSYKDIYAYNEWFGFYDTGKELPRIFDQDGHHTKYVRSFKYYKRPYKYASHMHLLEIDIFSLYHGIVRHTKIMNRANKNWAHFYKQSTFKIKVFKKFHF